MARADWTSDETYIKRLQRRVEDLKQAVGLFERHRRSLELVEAEIANVQLGLADPRSKPDELVARLLREAFPHVSLRITPLRTAVPRPPEGIAVWDWRCELAGAVSELRWATQLLRQKGLFIRPDPKEPVQLLLDPDQQRGKLIFIGHHVRLLDFASRELPDENRGPDMYATRTDPLALKIRQLRSEVTRLCQRVADIQGFEGRVNSIRQYIALLRRLTDRSRDPFQAITPLLDLELIRLDTVKHLGDQVVLEGGAPSRSMLATARRWLRRQARRRGVKIRHEGLQLLFGPPPTAPLEVPDPSAGAPRCSLVAASARGVDVGLAAVQLAAVQGKRGAAVVLGPSRTVISGVVRKDVMCDSALWAVARGVKLAPVRSARDLLLVPDGQRPRAEKILTGAHRGRNRSPLALGLVSTSVGHALSLLRSRLPGVLNAPRPVIFDKHTLSLVGQAPARRWLRLLGAAHGLQLAGKGSALRLESTPPTKLFPVPDPPQPAPPTKLFPVPDPPQPVPPTTPTWGLGQLQLRLLVLGKGRDSFGVVSDGVGTPFVLKRGMLVGKNRSQVIRISRRGIVLLWSGGGVTARVTLSPGVSTR